MLGDKIVKIYVDTNVYLDYLQDRPNLLGKPLGDDAWRIFSRVLSGQFHLVVSSFILEELYRQIEPAEAKMLFETMKKNISYVTYNAEEKANARLLNDGHWQDALHVLIAKRENVDLLVTQNYADYIQYQNLVKPIRLREI